MAKIIEDKKFKFCCNVCRTVCAADKNEQTALKKARSVARTQGREWKHPHWQLYCPNCK